MKDDSTVVLVAYLGRLVECKLKFPRGVILSCDLAKITAACAWTGMVTDRVVAVGIMGCELVLTETARKSDGDTS